MRRREVVLVSTAILAWTWGCQSVDRPPLRAEEADAAASGGREGDETDVALPPSPEPMESGPAVGGLDPGSMGGNQTPGAAAAAETCGLDAGVCTTVGDAGAGPACIPTGPRDCSSELDNDCDGQPDNVVDGVCVCALGTSEACEEHQGLDGNGPCRAGLRMCVLAADGLTTEWGACAGSIGPEGPDSCTVRGDDADCDGTPNTDCPCVDGDTQECGSTTDTGPCSIGTSTCVNGRFGACVGATPPAAQDSCAPGDDSNCNGRANDRFCACLNGATQQCGVTDTGACVLGTQTCVNGAFGACVGNVDPRSRDCRSQQDNNCDGQPDNARDNVCRCEIGSTQACDTHPQDGIGRCRAGTQTCVAGSGNSSSNFGPCAGSQGPLGRDCRSSQDNDCDGRPDNTIDNVCECVPGAGNGPCRDDPTNARCNDQGRCAPCQNDDDCSLVAGGLNSCENGECVGVDEPLDCTSPTPPQASIPPFTNIEAAAPAPTGGTIEDGVYVTTQVRFFNVDNIASVAGETLELRGGYFNRNRTTYSASTGDALAGFRAAGTFVTTQTSLATEGVACSVAGTPRAAEIWGYSVSGTRLEVFRSTGGRISSIETFVRQ